MVVDALLKTLRNDKTKFTYDPIMQQDGKWFFVDETSDLNGPHETEESACKALLAYMEWLSRPNEDELRARGAAAEPRVLARLEKMIDPDHVMDSAVMVRIHVPDVIKEEIGDGITLLFIGKDIMLITTPINGQQIYVHDEIFDRIVAARRKNRPDLNPLPPWDDVVTYLECTDVRQRYEDVPHRSGKTTYYKKELVNRCYRYDNQE